MSDKAVEEGKPAEPKKAEAPVAKKPVKKLTVQEQLDEQRKSIADKRRDQQKSDMAIAILKTIGSKADSAIPIPADGVMSFDVPAPAGKGYSAKELEDIRASVVAQMNVALHEVAEPVLPSAITMSATQDKIRVSVDAQHAASFRKYAIQIMPSKPVELS